MGRRRHGRCIKLATRHARTIWLIIITLGLGLATPALPQTIVGGPCRYGEFPGKATITAITPRPDPQRSLPYPGLDVTFTFTPDEPIAGDPLYVPGKTYPLTLAGGRAPGKRFVEKYGLHPGMTLPCQLRLIRQGTCTPVLFEFPGINLASDIDFSQK